jgi:hypothetical protein
VLRAERRRRGDLLAAAALVAAGLAAVGLVVLTSPAAHTTSVPAARPLPTAPATPSELPPTLAEAWRAPSSATSAPVTAGPVVVTGDGSTVTGRDPLTGRQRWLYRRDIPLCTVGAGWDMALAVYRRGGYCSEVTALQSATGKRGPQRNSDVRPGTQLLDDGALVTATGRDHLETWRSDLVETLEYGELRAQIEPGTQPRPNCPHTSVAVTSGLVGVIERCPHEPGDRLTVLRPDNTDSDHPDEALSTILPSTGAKLIALSEDREAVLLPGPTRLSVRDSAGKEVASYPLSMLTSTTGNATNVQVAPTTAIPGAYLWWTGVSTIALDSDDLHPLWVLPGALGPGTLLADQLLVPAPNAELVINPSNGTVLRGISVNRDGYHGPVTTSACGPMLLEQRGPLIVALR